MNGVDDTIARLMARGPHPRKHATTVTVTEGPK